MVAPPLVDGIVHAVIYSEVYGVDEFEQAQQESSKPGTVGWWDRVMQNLTAEQVESLNRAAGNPAITHRTISVVLGNWGHQVTPAMVGHWRRNYARR